MLNQFGKLYRNLIGHLVFIWLIFFVSGIVFLGISFLEQKIKSETNQKLSHSALILNFSSSLDSIQIISEFDKIDFIKTVEYKSSSKNISEMSEKFHLEGLENWVSKNELNDFLILYFNAEKFSLNRFQDFVEKISEDERFESVNFDAKKIILCGRIKNLIEKYKFYLLGSIIFIASIMLFFIRFFMRYFQKEKWKLWQSKGLKLYKFQHFVIEFFFLIFAQFLSLGLLVFIVLNKFHSIVGEKLFFLQSGYYAVFCLFGCYVIVSLINLVSKNDG